MAELGIPITFSLMLALLLKINMFGRMAIDYPGVFDLFILLFSCKVSILTAIIAGRLTLKNIGKEFIIWLCVGIFFLDISLGLRTTPYLALYDGFAIAFKSTNWDDLYLVDFDGKTSLMEVVLKLLGSSMVCLFVIVGMSCRLKKIGMVKRSIIKEDVVLEAKNINKRIGSYQVLIDVNLKIYKEEIVTVLGSVGSGKTSLSKILGGKSTYQSGKIGVDFEAKDKVVFIPSNIHLSPKMCCKDYLDLAKKHYDRSTFLNVLYDCGINPCIPIEKLNLYERRKLLWAMALLMNPKVLIWDEPIGGLDSKDSKSLLKTIRTTKRDASLVLFTSDAEMAKDVSDRIVVINEGKIVHDAMKEDFDRETKGKFILTIDYNLKVVQALRDMNYVYEIKCGKICIVGLNCEIEKFNPIFLIVKNEALKISFRNMTTVDVLHETMKSNGCPSNDKPMDPIGSIYRRIIFMKRHWITYLGIMIGVIGATSFLCMKEYDPFEDVTFNEETEIWFKSNRIEFSRISKINMDLIKKYSGEMIEGPNETLKLLIPFIGIFLTGIFGWLPFLEHRANFNKLYKLRRRNMVRHWFENMLFDSIIIVLVLTIVITILVLGKTEDKVWIGSTLMLFGIGNLPWVYLYSKCSYWIPLLVLPQNLWIVFDMFSWNRSLVINLVASFFSPQYAINVVLNTKNGEFIIVFLVMKN